MKILSIVGARPQFIKAAIVSRSLRDRGIKEVLVHTGQHYDPEMSAVFFTELAIPHPDHALEVGSGGHGSQTARMLEGLEQVIVAERPTLAIVYGDTNSTLAGALAAAKLHVPVVHVEAGLRSFNRRMPEEINRVLTDHASDLLFAPSQTAIDNMLREGLLRDRIHLVGDVMYDAVRRYGPIADRRSGVIRRLGLRRQGYVLSTIHRADNTDLPERLSAIVEALVAIAEQTPVVLPLHPRTRQALSRAGLLPLAARSLIVTEPLGYFDMMAIERHARLIVTDSGGVQKEAHFHGVPAVIVREETEWVELLETGASVLAPPTSTEALATAIRQMLGRSPRAHASPYGDGTSGDRIARVLETFA